jgi:hypothetical protein
MIAHLIPVRMANEKGGIACIVKIFRAVFCITYMANGEFVLTAHKQYDHPERR